MKRIAIWLLFLTVAIGAASQLNAQSVTLGWSPSSDPSVTGYIIYWGTVSADYTASNNVGTNTAVTISNLAAGTTYYFALKAYDAAGLQSAFSPEISYTVPGATTFTFANLTQTYNGSPESVTVTTNPTNVPVTVTYNGSANAPVNARLPYTVVATAQKPCNGQRNQHIHH